METKINKQILLNRLSKEGGWSDEKLKDLLLCLHDKGWLSNGSVIFPSGVEPSDFLKRFRNNKTGN